LSRKAVVGAVTRQLLVKTLLAGKDLACTLLICKVWKNSDDAIIKCHESCVKVANKSNIRSNIPSRVCSVISYVEYGDECADMASSLCIHFIYFMQRTHNSHINIAAGKITDESM
jgi:hypothetical protein